MITLPTVFPFTKLRLPEEEQVEWVGFNPTFHRYRSYGLVVTDRSLFVCKPSWLLAKWKRYPLSEVSDAVVVKRGLSPAIKFRAAGREVVVRVPFDLHASEAEFDLNVLRAAVSRLPHMQPDPG